MTLKRDMEERLTRTYRKAWKHKTQHREKRALFLRRSIRSGQTNDIRVRIHNIRSARPEPEIEMLYTVYKEGE